MTNVLLISAVDLSSWREKIEGEIAGVETEHEVEIRMEEVKEFTRSNHERYKDGILTIGCCGKKTCKMRYPQVVLVVM